MNDVNARNAESFRVALADLTRKVLEQSVRIDQQNAKIATLDAQVTTMITELNLLRARTSGSGPTVR